MRAAEPEERTLKNMLRMVAVLALAAGFSMTAVACGGKKEGGDAGGGGCEAAAENMKTISWAQAMKAMPDGVPDSVKDTAKEQFEKAFSAQKDAFMKGCAASPEAAVKCYGEAKSMQDFATCAGKS
ncbi:MAG: NAD(P)H-dependent FMN reductase [Myxococcota bacterium]|jgi:NAD(P)H-dependent FMN reductase